MRLEAGIVGAHSPDGFPSHALAQAVGAATALLMLADVRRLRTTPHAVEPMHSPEASVEQTASPVLVESTGRPRMIGQA